MISVMKRNILLIATVLYATIGWSQTMNIHYKNGQTVQYNMNNIDYVEYTEDNPNNAQVSSGEAVDLGLSVLWASCNVGATSPEQYGDRYAWGETESRNKFTRENYLYYDKDSDCYIDIGTDIKGTDYDVAHVKWANNWRMPTSEELRDLENKCKWEWVNINNINGYKVIGANGNSIFLPVGKEAAYWSSSLCPSTLGGMGHGAYEALLEPGVVSMRGISRFLGHYIRPVKSK